jgi:hypothetical protein
MPAYVQNGLDVPNLLHQMQNPTAEQFIAHSSAMAFKVVVIVSCFHIYVRISLDFLDLPIVHTAF